MNKISGNGGLRIGFYLEFWPFICKFLVDYVKYIYEFGELSSTQKQAIIKLVEKRIRLKG